MLKNEGMSKWMFVFCFPHRLLCSVSHIAGLVVTETHLVQKTGRKMDESCVCAMHTFFHDVACLVGMIVMMLG